MKLIREVKAYNETLPIPGAYRGSSKVRAIVLGTDPTARDIKGSIKQFQKVFNIGSSNQYFAGIENNFKSVLGEYWKDGSPIMSGLYVQNLCTDYLEHETSSYNKKSWCNFVKAGGYVEKLKKELSEFPPEIPVLITAEILITALLIDEKSKKKASYYYNNLELIDAYENTLGRSLIPFFRHPKYKIKSWPQYAKVVENALAHPEKVIEQQK